MKFERVEYNSLRKIKRKMDERASLLISAIYSSNEKCVKIIDDENVYNNNNDLARVIAQRIENGPYKDKLKSFMVNGDVYVKRVQE